VGQPLRDVRPSRGFYADLHRQLPAERGEDGTPSRVDFELYDLVDILNTFARDWDNLPPLIPSRSDYRILITTGVLVAAYSVQALLNQDGVVELISLGIDLRPLPGADDHDIID
jgi:hypothetical protein